MRNEVYGEWIRILEETGKGNQQGSITVAATLKSLNNTHTNAQGQLAGLARGRIIEKQKVADEAVVLWASKQPAYGKALDAKKELDRLALEHRSVATRDFMFQAIRPGPVALRVATTLVRLAVERTKPDAERDPDYMERQWKSLRNTMEREQQSFYRPADEAMLSHWIARAAKLAPGERIGPLEGKSRQDVALWYQSTKVTDPAERLRMFDESTAQLRARHDPMLDLAFALEPELRQWQAATQTYEGAVARLRPEWRRAVIAHAGKPVAPDANGTLRVSIAHVQGYVPRDGVLYTPQTTLAGMLEKHTGDEPFAPGLILDAAKEVKAEQVPLNFLANADTTGGNSGSPVINGRGELVGLNFDRVWENVANDFGYNPDIARNVSVDIRFFLWLLEDVQKADGVLRVLGVK